MEIVVIAVILLIIFVVKQIQKDYSPDARNGDLGGSFFTDPRDGKKYRTVKIGDQVWMAENLNYDARGSKWYNNDPANAKKYGRFYDWETAIKACPKGWHLPSDDEWETLINFVGGSSTAGKYLKAKSGWDNNDNGTDTYGFAALPGGFARDLIYFVGEAGYWWSATEYTASRAYYRHMIYEDERVLRDDGDKSVLHSVRCVQDQDNGTGIPLKDQGNKTEVPLKDDFLL